MCGLDGMICKIENSHVRDIDHQQREITHYGWCEICGSEVRSITRWNKTLRS